MATTTGAVTAAAAGTGSLGQEAYERLLTELVSLEITPGERLSVDALARRYRISQTPIREALARLESDGLVIKTHLRGFTAAAGFSRREFAQLFDIRLLLDECATGEVTRWQPCAVQAVRTAAEGFEPVRLLSSTIG